MLVASASRRLVAVWRGARAAYPGGVLVLAGALVVVALAVLLRRQARRQARRENATGSAEACAARGKYWDADRGSCMDAKNCTKRGGEVRAGACWCPCAPAPVTDGSAGAARPKTSGRTFALKKNQAAPTPAETMSSVPATVETPAGVAKADGPAGVTAWAGLSYAGTVLWAPSERANVRAVGPGMKSIKVPAGVHVRLYGVHPTAFLGINGPASIPSLAKMNRNKNNAAENWGDYATHMSVNRGTDPNNQAVTFNGFSTTRR